MPDNEQLCALAQAGDAAAREQLFEHNMGFVRRFTGKQGRAAST